MYNRPNQFRRTLNKTGVSVINTIDGKLTTVKLTGDSTLVKTNGDKIETIKISGDVKTTVALTGISTLVKTNGDTIITVPGMSSTFYSALTGQTTTDYILIIHLDASVRSSINMVGNVVSSWKGQTHNGVASTIYSGAVDATRDVTYNATGLNNKPTLVFPELAALNLGILPTNARIKTQDVSVFIVLQDNEQSTSHGYILGWDIISTENNNDPRFYINTTPHEYGGAIGRSVYSTNTYSGDRFNTPAVLVYRFQSTGTEFSVWRNNIRIPVDILSTVDTITDMINTQYSFGIGGLGKRGSVETAFGSGFNGNISEIKVYNKSFTDEEILNESTNLYNKWILV
jgi:hypothetical protein